MATHPYRPWAKTSSLQATGSVPLTEDYNYRPLYPLEPQSTIGWRDIRTSLIAGSFAVTLDADFFAWMGFLTQLGSNAIRKVPLHKGTMAYVRYTLIGAVLGQVWHNYYGRENVRWLNQMMQLEVHVQELKAKQEHLLAGGKTLAEAYPLK